MLTNYADNVASKFSCIIDTLEVVLILSSSDIMSSLDELQLVIFLIVSLIISISFSSKHHNNHNII